MPTSYPTTATHGDFSAGRYPSTRGAEQSRSARGKEQFADYTTAGSAAAIPAHAPRAYIRKIPKRELLTMTSQLAIMTRSGVDITSALQSLARQARRPAVKAMLEQVYNDVLAGQSVSAAMKRYSHVFGESYVASIAAGEAASRLPDVLK
jgi:type II secretory pathway component PulF